MTDPTRVLPLAEGITRVADDALLDAENERHHLSQYIEDAIITQSLIAGTGHREVREFIFHIQPMFGVRVRSPRPVQGAASFLIAGTPIQIQAVQRTLMMLHDLARPVVADLGSGERRQFWATLGSLCSTTDAAASLIAANRDASAAAGALLTEVYGRPARTLPRAAPATEGSVYEQAAAAVALTVRMPFGILGT